MRINFLGLERENRMIKTSLLLFLGIVCIVSVEFFVIPLIKPIEPKESEAQTKIILSQVKTALVEFRKDCGKFPSKNEGLSALVSPTKSCGGKAMRWPYLNKLPKDGWGKEFEYKSEAQKIRVSASEPTLYFECEVLSGNCGEEN